MKSHFDACLALRWYNLSGVINITVRCLCGTPGRLFCRLFLCHIVKIYYVYCIDLGFRFGIILSEWSHLSQFYAAMHGNLSRPRRWLSNWLQSHCWGQLTISRPSFHFRFDVQAVNHLNPFTTLSHPPSYKHILPQFLLYLCVILWHYILMSSMCCLRWFKHSLPKGGRMDGCTSNHSIKNH